MTTQKSATYTPEDLTNDSRVITPLTFMVLNETDAAYQAPATGTDTAIFWDTSILLLAAGTFLCALIQHRSTVK